MNEKQVTPELLKRYLDGDCNVRECEVVERWLESGDRETEVPEAFLEVDQEALKGRLWEAVVPQKTNRSPRFGWWAAAAVAMLVSGFSIWFLPSDTDPRTEIGHNLHVFETKPGQQSTVKLPDGSTIRLNAGTRLWYNLPFDVRTVVIEGEGLFDIAPDPTHPFTVKTSKGNVRVLGTSFNVKSYRESKTTEISVRNGLVACATKKSDFSVNLKKGESVQFNAQSMSGKLVIADTEIAPWTKNILVFNAEPFQDVIGQIERWFGVKVHLDPGIDNLNGALRAKFIDPKLTDVVQSLCFSLNAKYRIINNDIYIYN